MRTALSSTLGFTAPVALMIAIGCSTGGVSDREETTSDPTPSRAPNGWHAAYDEVLGTPTFLTPPADSAPVLVDGVTPRAAAMQFFENNPQVCGLSDPTNDLVVEDEVTLASMQTTHVIYRQVRGSVPVWGTRIGVHFDPDGRIDFVSGRCIPDVASVDVAPALSEGAAVKAAQEELRRNVDPGAETQSHSARTVIYGLDGKPRAAWEVSLHHEAAAWDYVIDGESGDVLASNNHAKAAMASGGGVLYHGASVTSDVKTFSVESFITDPPKYYMSLRGSGSKTEIEVRDSRHCAGAGDLKLCDPVESLTLDGGWDEVAPGAGQAVDAYVYLQEVDQYYRTTHEWASVDGAGIPLIVEVHAPEAYNNAFFGGIHEGVDGQPHLWRHAEIAFGDRASGLTYAGAPDVVAHEFQHGVTDATLGLNYNGYSDGSAIAEHLSDAFASFYERRHHAGLNPYVLGDAIGATVRRMDDPVSLGHPDCMDKKAKGFETAHANSEILSHALYLMSEGGTCKTTEERVQYPIGWENAEKLYFAIVRSKPIAPSGSQFADFARATVSSAMHLPNGHDRKTGPAVAVACAWNAVNVLEPGELFDTWQIECPPPRDCFGGPACDEGRVCSWNGPDERYCCKAPPKGEHTCFSDDECKKYGESMICSQGTDGFYCVEPDDDCIPPPPKA